jgi:hypothetical protein
MLWRALLLSYATSIQASLMGDCFSCDRFVRSWIAALQVVLICGTLLMALGLLPFLYFVAHWYLMQGSPLETWDSPPRSLIRRLSARGERGKPRSTDGNKGEHALTQKPEKQHREGELNDSPLDGKPGRSISFQQADSTEMADEGAKGEEVSRGMDFQEGSLDGNRRRSSLSVNLQQACSSSKVREVFWLMSSCYHNHACTAILSYAGRLQNSFLPLILCTMAQFVLLLHRLLCWPPGIGWRRCTMLWILL